MRLSLSHRLTLVFSLFGVAIAGSIEYYHLRETRVLAYEREASLADAAGASVKALVEAQYRTGAVSRLNKSFDDLVRQTDIASVMVFDTKGNRLLYRFDNKGLADRVPHPKVPLAQITDGIYDIERSVDLAGRPGFLELGFRTSPLEAQLRDLRSGAVRSFVMTILAVMLSAWLLGAWLGLRLSQLLPRIEALARGSGEFRPLRGGDGDDELGRLVAAFNRLGASLKQETLRRREVEREKQDLAAMLVHDLKTPLTVIRSGITLLQEQLAEDGPRPKAEVIAAKKKGGRAPSGTHERTFQLLEMSTKRLQRMVEDVLQLARLEEVSGLRERVPVDLGAMIESCGRDFALVAEDRSQRVAVELPREPLPRVLGDAVLLRRVLDNLTHNAVEHTPPGGTITIGASARNGLVKVTVSDSGPGVPADVRADLFRKFYQKDVKRHVGNVGLGLAFCEKVVARHEGAIGVEDAEPRGARFFFELPSEQPHLL